MGELRARTTTRRRGDEATTLIRTTLRATPSPVAALVATLVVALVTVVLPARAGAASSAPPTCHGKRATIVGTPEADVIVGTNGPDVIVGLGGHDDIRGRGGNDLICGNTGADDLYGGPGNDVLIGGFGAMPYAEHDELWPNLLDGGAGNDLLDPGPRAHRSSLPNIVSFTSARRGVHVSLPRGRATGQGKDRIVQRRAGLAVLGSRHDDVIKGSPRNEVLMGSRGDDRVLGGKGRDEISDGAGWMRRHMYAAPKDDPKDVDVLFGGSGPDMITGDSPDTVLGGGGQDFLQGSGRVLRGGPGADELLAVLAPGWAPRVLDGGPGRDRLDADVPKGAGALKTDLRSGVTTFVRTGRRIRLTNLESLWLENGRAPWTVWGTGKNEVFSSGGPTTVHAGGGNDRIDTGRHDDRVDGGPGRDRAYTDRGNDTCINVEKGWGGCSN